MCLQYQLYAAVSVWAAVSCLAGIFASAVSAAEMIIAELLMIAAAAQKAEIFRTFECIFMFYLPFVMCSVFQGLLCDGSCCKNVEIYYSPESLFQIKTKVFYTQPDS